MARSRSFSIYLLKKEFTAENALKEEHSLEKPVNGATELPDGATIYIADIKAKHPWWRSYWGIQQKIWQESKGALVFIPIEDRCFAITFGHTYHNLKEECYEYDFGLRTTLNALDPQKIKSTDILQPENARRERIQSPVASDFNYFDFNNDESILKKLTGAVKEAYKDMLTNITGASNLVISSKLPSNEICTLCSKLLSIYVKDDFKKSFPDIQNIIPVKDPLILSMLNLQLINAFNSKAFELVLSIPEISEHDESFYVKYSGAGRDDLFYNEVYIDHYREYLQRKKITDITIENLKFHKLNIQDENEVTRKSYSVYKCLLFDTKHKNMQYHLCEGEWYQINNDFIEKVKLELDPIFRDYPLLDDCNKLREDEYNRSISEKGASAICLDKTNISINGQSQVEPCDIYQVEDEIAHLVHIKISTRSAALSHLFNQGVNAVQLLQLYEESRSKLKKLLPDLTTHKPIDDGKYCVIYGIITAKDKLKKSDALPIFSRISLLRCVKTLKLMRVPITVVLIRDLVDRKKIDTKNKE